MGAFLGNVLRTASPYPFPQLQLKTPESSGLEALLNSKWSDIELIGYKSHPRIKLAMNA